MIIDAHCHIWERDLIQGDMSKLLDSVIQELGVKDEENIRNGSIERLIRDMDEAGIDKTIILPIDFEFFYAAGEFTFKDFNNLAGDYLKQFPDRIIAFAGVDPRRGVGAVTELRRCVEEMGFQGLKLWTVTGFVPDDTAYYPLYEEAARLGINILVHTGQGPGNTYLKSCRPVFVDKLAVDFREINFIMAHMGMPWIDEALTVCMKNPNVYVDISGWQPISALYPMELAQVLSRAKQRYLCIHKVLFGSDWPLFSEIYSQKQWVDTIKNLTHPELLQMMGLPEITKEDKELILGLNAKMALRL